MPRLRSQAGPAGARGALSDRAKGIPVRLDRAAANYRELMFHSAHISQLILSEEGV